MLAVSSRDASCPIRIQQEIVASGSHTSLLQSSETNEPLFFVNCLVLESETAQKMEENIPRVDVLN